MKTTVNSEFFGGGKYAAPEIEMYESVVERGFFGTGDDETGIPGFILDENGNIVEENNAWNF